MNVNVQTPILPRSVLRVENYYYHTDLSGQTWRTQVLPDGCMISDRVDIDDYTSGEMLNELEYELLA